jgi:hypothetical protein
MATKPLSDLTATWNAAGTTFTAIKMNATDTASAAGSLLLDLQIGGTSQAKVSKGGVLTTLGRASINTLTVGLGGQTSVASNTAVGFETLNSASLTGADNTGVGYQALKAVTTGVNNAAFGLATLRATTTGQFNTAVGGYALADNTTGSSCIAVGLNALIANTTGGNNIGVGCYAGDVITTGERNTIIGDSSDPSANNGNDQTVVGQGLTGKGNDTAFIGGTNGAYNEKNVTTWETTSDARIKKNIADFSDGLAVIEALRVRTFEYRSPEEITELPQSAAIDRPGIQLGVIAQEFQTVLPTCVTENSTGVLSVNTDQLVWYLVNAVKQLSAEVNALKGA